MNIMKCTVGDFKKMIEEMNIPDTAVIETVHVEARGYFSHAEFRPVDFSVMKYDNGVVTTVSDSIDADHDRIRIGEVY